MTAAPDRRALIEALDWQIELGADEAIGEAPINRFDRAAAADPRPAPPPDPVRGAPPVVAGAPAPGDAGAGAAAGSAAAVASAAMTLADLQAAVAGFDGCELKRGARNTVFADGQAGARVMIVGEAPGADEDRLGKPFVGRAGQLLDAMFRAIGLARDDGSLYIANILPWRPPGNRTPDQGEIDLMMPFVRRHVDLAQPDVLIPMGNVSCLGLLGRQGITRIRGNWTRALDRPALPMFHPAYLLRSPAAKREAWADLLALKAWLRDN